VDLEADMVSAGIEVATCALGYVVRSAPGHHGVDQ